MNSTQQRRIRGAGCDVFFDNLTRQLYATDASIYQVEPAGVAFPRNAEQASAIIRETADAAVSITPRGAGTSLSGGAIGDGLIVDFSRHNRQISELDLDKRTVRVGAGVVLDQLNAFLEPHGFCFGPDVATSSRATIGGMIANNSSGAHVPVYGTTADHVRELEIVLADGRIANVHSLGEERARIETLVRAKTAEILERMPPGMMKRWSGYGLARFLRTPQLTEILAGSEGTLAAISSAQLHISTLPRQKGLGIIFFASVAEAMQATVELLGLKPAAIEHVDRPVFEQTKGQLHFQAARDLLELDARPCESFLIVEFYEDVDARLSTLQTRRLGLRSKCLTDPVEMNLVWMMRKAGLSLLTGCVGAAKPVAFIEDAAIPPRHLPEYVASLRAVMAPLGLRASFYGHAAAGLLHVRPVLDLHNADDLRKMRQVAEETSALVRQFKGSFSAEHGVGMARTEFMPEQLGAELLELMGEIKRVFDPRNVFNPGKIFGDGRSRVDQNLRINFEKPMELPFEPALAFAFKDRSFIGNLEQCNGCGGCRKEAPMMCPTFLATGEEVMSTRGRANIIRAALELRVNGRDPLKSEELEVALSNCLACKGCTPECPSNVNLALLKAELMHARYRRDGLPWRIRMLSNIDLLGKLGCAMPGPANAALDSRLVRWLMSKTAGLSAKRSLPHYASKRFDRWFSGRAGTGIGDSGSRRGRVVLWDDTFVRYNEPHIGIAAVKVLEALGFEVALPKGRRCCGRPAFSQGNLSEAARLGRHNLDLLGDHDAGTPILFLEPSCYSMFVEDYRELQLAKADEVARRCFLFEKFVADLFEREPEALRFRELPGHVAIHAHCHAKSLLQPEFMARLAGRLPGKTATLLDTGCCGMAGAFGALEEKYDLSVKVGALLVEKVKEQPADALLVASGTSCRHQLAHLTSVTPRHMAELLAESLI
jgi:FAD/FMN-containing dehydrogenase/Fe-S oxidoreductase